MNEGDFIRGYRLKQELGRGSYGDVWLAEKQMDFGGGKIYYALKFLRNRNEKGVDIEKVIKEIVAWTKASSHPNIISIRDSFIDHGKYIIVSDYADGGSLKNRDFSFEDGLKIIEEVLSGIEYLHNVPIIHRDIKPENILLKNGVACISDFGLAREFDKTQSTGLGGSINYFSPEMAKKEIENEEHERTPLDDLWATAVTFYQLITGALPFRKLGNIIKCQREPLPKNFPAELTGFFDKAFHEDRKSRFQSAKEMHDVLKKTVFLESEYVNEIVELRFQFNDLQVKLIESQNNANLLYKMVAEERSKFLQLTAAKEEIEKKSTTGREDVRNLQDQIDILQDRLQDLQDLMDKTAAENVKLKKHLLVLRKQYVQPQSKKPGITSKNLRPVALEKSFFEAGNDFLSKKEYDQAINQFTEAIKLNSGNANAYYKRGIAYNGRGTARGNQEDYDKAIRDYYQATFLNGNDIKVFQRRPVTYTHTGNQKLSVKDYKRLLKLHPIFNSAYANLKKAKKERRSEILRLILKWSVFLFAFVGIYVSTFVFTQPLASYTASFLRHNLFDWGAAGETIVFVVFITACIALSMLLLVVLAAYLKDVLRSRLPERIIFITFSGVGLLFSGYLVYSSFFTTNYYQAANECYEKKDYVCAVENYTTAIKWSPKYWLTSENGAYNGRGAAYFKMGDIDQAVKDYSEAVKLNPDDARAAENLKLANQVSQKKSYQP